MWGSWSTTMLVGLGLVALGIGFVALGPIYALVLAVVIGAVLLALAAFRRSGEYVEKDESERVRRDEVDRISAGTPDRGGPHTSRGDDVPEPLPASPEGPSRTP